MKKQNKALTHNTRSSVISQKAKKKKKMKSGIRLLVITLFALTSLTMCKNEADKVEYVKFELIHSRRIPNHKVQIEITKKNSIYFLHLQSSPIARNTIWEKTRIDTTFIIDNTAFKKVSREVYKLSKCDFSKSEIMGLDGYDCTIKFGFEGKEKTYNFWTPNYDTEERGLTDYLKACNLMIKTAGLKTEEIL